jgi:hypothetical protein
MVSHWYKRPDSKAGHLCAFKNRHHVLAQVVLRYDGGRGAITALGLTHEECILAGTAEGAMLVFAPDSRRRITRRLPLADVRVPGAGPVPPGPERTLRFDF